ncbi:MAG: energy-coupling factor transporter transmembrane protein EcfT [Desulfobacter sp.]|nr:energy-coupling factor transporter transmembrane protein EcfT [Desulfobacter sp.]
MYLLPGGWQPDLILLAVNTGAAVSAKIFKPAWKIVWKTMLPLGLFMVPIHGMFYPENHTLLIPLGPFSVYREGLVFALNTLAPILVLLFVSLFFVLTTHPADLITVISQTAKSPWLAYLLGSPLLLLPAMRDRIVTIQSAQRARGRETDGHLLKRFLGLAPLVIPLVMGSLVEIEQRATALELRGFKSENDKTSVRIVSDLTRQKQFRRLMLAAAFVIVLYGLRKVMVA